jgi:hypothetical protein
MLISPSNVSATRAAPAAHEANVPADMKSGLDVVLVSYYEDDRMSLPEPRLVGGSFWWDFRQDMVPNTLPLWSVLDAALGAGPWGQRRGP